MFAVHDLVKDLGLALDLYERANAAVPLTREARALFAEAASESGDLDISAIVNAFSSGNRGPLGKKDANEMSAPRR